MPGHVPQGQFEPIFGALQQLKSDIRRKKYMKKRLLSAALALAMVLTLLPVTAVTALAADEPSVSTTAITPTDYVTNPTVTYYKEDAINPAKGLTNPAGWYFHETANGKNVYHKVESGVINGTNSGAWYATPWKDATSWNTTNFTVIGTNFDMSSCFATTNLTINLHGGSATWNLSNIGANFTSLTIQDTATDVGLPNGTFTLNNFSIDHQFTLTANNVKITGDVSLTSSGTANSTHSVKLTNSTITGNVTLDGTTVADKTEAQQSLSLDQGSSITGAVEVTGDRSTITLSPNTQWNRGSAITGSNVDLVGDNATLTLNSLSSVTATVGVTGNSSKIEVKGGGITGASTITGYGTQVNVSGAGEMGQITLSDAGVTAANKSQTAPTVNHTGTGHIGSIVANMTVLENPNIIKITGKGHVADGSQFTNATITVTDSHMGTITKFEKGSLTVTGTQNVTQSASVGEISDIGSAGNPAGTRTGQVTITVSGTNVEMGGMTGLAGNVNPINLNLSGDTNKYLGTNPVPNDNERAGGTVIITGGTFGASIKESKPDGTGYTNYLPSTLLFEIVENTPATYTYVDTIQKAQQIQGGDTTKYTVGWRDGYETTGSTHSLTLKIGGKTELVIQADEGKVLPLPTSLSGRNNIKTWTNSSDPTDTYTAGKTYTMGKADMTLEALDVELDITEITDITVVSPAGVTAELDKAHKTIKLGGVVDFTSAQVDVVLNIKTSNAKETEVTVTYTKALNTTVFSSVSTTNGPNGLEIKGSGELEVPGGARYTATSSFSDLNKALKVGGMGTVNSVPTGNAALQATINVPGWNNEQKKITSTALETSATVDFSESNAIWGAVNKVMASTNSRVSSLLTTANTNYCKQILNITNPTATQVQNLGPFTTIWIYAYLDVRVKTINDGLMTADLVPSYKLIAGDATAPTLTELTALKNVTTTLKVTNDCALAQDLTSLGNLTGTAGTVKFKLGGWNPYTAPTDATAVAHQDGKYAYEYNTTDNAFVVTHISTSNGLGAFVFNSTKPLVELYRWNSAPAGGGAAAYEKVDTYDNLQAAANDTKYVNTTAPSTLKEDYVQVLSGYTGPTAISLSGERRVFTIKTASGVQPVTITNSQADGWQLDNNSTNTEYKVQLFRNTEAKPDEKPVSIVVAAAANGSVVASATKANYGDTITLTIKPNAGYGLSTLNVRTNTGAAVTYQSTTTNVFTFKVPQDVTTITVTPTFAVSSVAVISVTDTVNGLASTNAANNKAAGGSTVTVTTRPFNGYRTSAVTAVTNTGAAVAVARIAENTYTFVVPVTATRVVITPTFSASGHPFTDVASGQWYSDAVSFGYRHGMFTGYNGSSTRFAGMEKLTRAELVVILYRLSNEPATTSNSGFSDVSPSAWYAKAITWATQNNIVRGGDNNRFYPLNYVTREELSQMLYGYNSYRGGTSGVTGNLSRFVDSNRVHAYHLTAMQWAVGNNVVQGSGNQLNPGGNATRYEAATMLMRYAQTFMGRT